MVSSLYILDFNKFPKRINISWNLKVSPKLKYPLLRAIKRFLRKDSPF
jgi:hypothetical protein